VTDGANGRWHEVEKIVSAVGHDGHLLFAFFEITVNGYQT